VETSDPEIQGESSRTSAGTITVIESDIDSLVAAFIKAATDHTPEPDTPKDALTMRQWIAVLDWPAKRVQQTVRNLVECGKMEFAGHVAIWRIVDPPGKKSGKAPTYRIVNE
jgi:hypothetical protein